MGTWMTAVAAALPVAARMACLAVVMTAATALHAQSGPPRDAVGVFRQGKGHVCHGWLASREIVVTAAHCVTEPGHFWVRYDGKEYHGWRTRFHPEFTSEFLFFPPDEINADLALIVILQRNLSHDT